MNTMPSIDTLIAQMTSRANRLEELMAANERGGTLQYVVRVGELYLGFTPDRKPRLGGIESATHFSYRAASYNASIIKNGAGDKGAVCTFGAGLARSLGEVDK